jgi:hypothetical protein
MKTFLPALFLTFALQVAPPTFAQDPNAVMQACRSDARSLCRGMRPGNGAIAECLRKQMDKLSPACAAALPQATNPCAQELRQRCEAAGHTGPAALSKCMRGRTVEVSPECAAKSPSAQISGG